MSWLSQDWHAFTKWLGSIESPSSKGAASTAAGTLSQGLTQAEAAGELIVTDAANAALALVPAGLGLLFTPAVDNLIAAIAAKILSKHSNPVAAVATLTQSVLAGAPSAAGQPAPAPAPAPAVTMDLIPDASLAEAHSTST